MTKLSLFFLGLAALGLVACGGGNSSSKQASYQLNDSCVIPSTWGSTAESSACVEATDCAGKCCNCASSSKSWAGAACVEGKCAGNSVTCALTASTDFCD